MLLRTPFPPISHHSSRPPRDCSLPRSPVRQPLSSLPSSMNMSSPPRTPHCASPPNDAQAHHPNDLVQGTVLPPSTSRQRTAAHDPFNPQAPNQCPVCGREYKSPCGMRQHYLSHFSPQYICEVDGCGRRFKKKYLLTRHERTHSGARPFKCPVESCGKEFTRKNNMQAHLHRKHMPGVHVPEAKRPQLTQYARGGRTPEFTLEEFQPLARFIARPGVPPTAAEAVERAKEILLARQDNTRNPTTQKMHTFASKLQITLSKPNSRRKIYYPPVEKAVAEPDLQTYFDQLFLLRPRQEKQVRPRAQTKVSLKDMGDVFSLATFDRAMKQKVAEAAKKKKATARKQANKKTTAADAARMAKTLSRSRIRQNREETEVPGARSTATSTPNGSASDVASVPTAAPAAALHTPSRLVSAFDFEAEIVDRGHIGADDHPQSERVDAGDKSSGGNPKKTKAVNDDEMTPPDVEVLPLDDGCDSSEENASTETCEACEEQYEPQSCEDCNQPVHGCSKDGSEALQDLFEPIPWGYRCRDCCFRLKKAQEIIEEASRAPSSSPTHSQSSSSGRCSQRPTPGCFDEKTHTVEDVPIIDESAFSSGASPTKKRKQPTATPAVSSASAAAVTDGGDSSAPLSKKQRKAHKRPGKSLDAAVAAATSVDPPAASAESGDPPKASSESGDPPKASTESGDQLAASGDQPAAVDARKRGENANGDDAATPMSHEATEPNEAVAAAESSDRKTPSKKSKKKQANKSSIAESLTDTEPESQTELKSSPAGSSTPSTAQKKNDKTPKQTQVAAKEAATAATSSGENATEETQKEADTPAAASSSTTASSPAKKCVHAPKSKTKQKAGAGAARSGESSKIYAEEQETHTVEDAPIIDASAFSPGASPSKKRKQKPMTTDERGPEANHAEVMAYLEKQRSRANVHGILGEIKGRPSNARRRGGHFDLAHADAILLKKALQKKRSRGSLARSKAAEASRKTTKQANSKAPKATKQAKRPASERRENSGGNITPDERVEVVVPTIRLSRAERLKQRLDIMSKNRHVK